MCAYSRQWKFLIEPEGMVGYFNSDMPLDYCVTIESIRFPQKRLH